LRYPSTIMAAGSRAARQRRWSSSLALCAIVAVAPAARADDASEARLHFELGTRDAQARRYASALEHFAAAYRLAPTARTLFNLAQSHDALADESRDERAAAQHRDRAFEHFSAFLARPEHNAGPQGAALSSLATAALARLSPRVARVFVRSSVAGATVFVDRVELGSYGALPRMIANTPSEHVLIVRAPGHRDAEVRCSFRLGESQEITIDPSPLLGAVELRLQPDRALVSVDGGPYVSRDTGSTLSLSPGVHRFALRSEGYLDATREFELRAEQRLVIDQRLALDPTRAAVLTVRSDRTDAVTRLGRDALGPANSSRVSLALGPVELEVSARDRAPWRGVVLLRAGRETSVRVIHGVPGASRPAWQWALLVGGATALLGGVGLGSAALVDRSALQYPNASAAQLSRISALNAATDVALAAGLGALTAGVIAWLSTPDPARSRAVIVEEGLRER
jgi:outer membrane receptor for ferrienterochelin and colicins